MKQKNTPPSLCFLQAGRARPGATRALTPCSTRESRRQPATHGGCAPLFVRLGFFSVFSMPRVDIWDVAKAKAAPAVDAGYERGFAEK